MNDTSKPLNRNHFRAAVSAKTRAFLTEGGKGIRAGKLLDIPVPEEILKIGEKDVETFFNAFAGAFHYLDEKLDRILEKLEGRENDAREIEVIDTVDISGSGISLLVAENLAIGDMIRLAVMLPGYPYGRLETLGRIVRTVEKNEGGTACYQVGIVFTGLSDDEKERLVQYTFSEQRRQIRATGNEE